MSKKMSYTERLAAFRDASAPKRRKAHRRSSKASVTKTPRRRARSVSGQFTSTAMVLAPRRPSMHVQSLLFSRRAGWTVSRAKAWAKSHTNSATGRPYHYGDVDETADYIHLRQEPPRGGVTRTITLGKGIKARVTRGASREGVKETAMAGKRRRAKTTAPRRRRRHTRAAAPAAAPRRRRRAHAAAPAAAPRRRRRRRHSMAAAPRRRRRRRAYAAAPRRRRRRHHASAPRRRRRRRHSYEASTTYAPRRRRHHRRAHAFSNPLSGGGEFALALISGGIGFAVADFVDRYMATYDPSAVAKGTTAAPTDRFYGGTNGTLANTLNIASPPNLMRIGVGVAVPAALGGLAYLTRKNRLACAAL